MYKKNQNRQITLKDFNQPLGLKLNPENKWIKKDARSKTQSKYVRDTIGNNVIEHSNGESALQYFSEKIKDDGLYLLEGVRTYFDFFEKHKDEF